MTDLRSFSFAQTAGVFGLTTGMHFTFHLLDDYAELAQSTAYLLDGIEETITVHSPIQLSSTALIPAVRDFALNIVIIGVIFKAFSRLLKNCLNRSEELSSCFIRIMPIHGGTNVLIGNLDYELFIKCLRFSFKGDFEYVPSINKCLASKLGERTPSMEK